MVIMKRVLYRISALFMVLMGACSFKPEMPADEVQYFDSADFTGKPYRNIHYCIQNTLGCFEQIDSYDVTSIAKSITQTNTETYLETSNYFNSISSSYDIGIGVNFECLQLSE